MKFKGKIPTFWLGTFGKYVLVLILFASWILFFDDHNLIVHSQNRQKLAQLEAQEEYYKKKIVADKLKLEELQTNDENLEKYAREQFMMKKEDEDIFLIVDKK